MYKIVVLSRARDEFEQCKSYILSNLNNQTAAAKLKKNFAQIEPRLTVFPHRQVLETYQGEKLYKINVANYCLFYLIDEKLKIVKVIAFVHSSRDWSRWLDFK